MQLPDERYRTQHTLQVHERLRGVPLPYITGRVTFMGLEMLAGPEANIPRQETEVLGYAALGLLAAAVRERGYARVMDLCTGSGNLGLALASLVPEAWLYGVDISAPAVRLARRNAAHLHIDSRTDFVVGDLLAPFESVAFWGQVDLIVCNPPYITSRWIDSLPFERLGFEPRLAYDGGASGMDIQERLLRDAPRFLRPGASLCLELGLGQAEILEGIARRDGYRQVGFVNDEQNQTRGLVVTA